MAIQKEVVLTPEGHKKLEEELEVLKVKRKEVAERIQDAKELGDLSENAEYHDAKNEQAFTEGRIAEIEGMLLNGTIISKPNKNQDSVQVGSIVKVTFSNTGEKKDFKIVGINEADPIQGLISNESPLGKAFLGRSKGESITVKTPKGEQIVVIEDISS